MSGQESLAISDHVKTNAIITGSVVQKDTAVAKWGGVETCARPKFVRAAKTKYFAVDTAPAI